MENAIINQSLHPEEGVNKKVYWREFRRNFSHLYHEKMKDDPVYKQKMCDNTKRYYRKVKDTEEFREKARVRQNEYREKMKGNEEYMEKRRGYNRKYADKKRAEKMQSVRSGSQ